MSPHHEQTGTGPASDNDVLPRMTDAVFITSFN